MAKYRKKPVVIDAYQWHGDNPYQMLNFMGIDDIYVNPETKSFDIETLEGTMTVSSGDWVIRGVKGELYPCKPDIFEATYEKVDVEAGGTFEIDKDVRFNFGIAISLLKEGKKVAREGWNGKGMWLYLVGPDDFRSYPAVVWETLSPVYDYSLSPWIGMKTADNKFVPWLASQTDMLAEDYHIVE